MKLRAYPKYKESGVEWLGEVPEEWVVKRLRFIAGLNPSKSECSGIEGDSQVSFLPMDAVGDDGSLNLEQVRPICEVNSGYTYFRDGDVTIAKITPCFENGKGAVMRGLQGGIGFGTTELIVIRPILQAAVGEYIHLLFVCAYFRKFGESWMYGAGGQKRVPDDFVRNFKVGIPPVAEQHAIAAFLDAEVSRMDALMAEYETLIDLLKEKRQALISHAVTKGLNPDVPMKDSGVEWLGEVPQHWRLYQTKRLFRLVVEQAPDDNNEELLSIYTSIGVRPRKSLEEKGNKATTTNGYWIVRKGDIIVNKLLAWMGAIGLSGYDGVTSPAYDIFRQIKLLAPKYYSELFRCGIMFSEFRRHSRGIMDMRLRLYFEDFGQIVIPYPPPSEQVEIVEFIEYEIGKMDKLMADAEIGVNLLKERRATLISDAVTGKIDVRDWQELV
jgi:type I restriction enzyme S subunit